MATFEMTNKIVLRKCVRFRWVHPSGALIGSYKQSTVSSALHRFHTGGSHFTPNKTLLPPSKLGGEPKPNDNACSCQLLPPSGQARTEGLSPKRVLLEATIHQPLG